jgi:hypothetical protein
MPTDVESVAAVYVHLPRPKTTALGPQDRGPMQQSESICVDFIKMNSRRTLLLRSWAAALLFSLGGAAQANPEATLAKEDRPESAEQAVHSTTTPADPLERRVAEIRERTANIHAGEAVRAKEATARHAQRRSEFSALREQLNVALSLPPASEERINQLNQTWTSLRNLVRRLQDDRIQSIDSLKLAKGDRTKTNVESIAPYKSDLKIQEALLGFSAALDARVLDVEVEIDATSNLLSNARVLRRRARSHASESAIQATESHQLMDIQAELSAIPIDIRSTFRQTLNAWWKNPAELNHIQSLGALFLGLMELAFLLVTGMWVHNQTPLWIRRLLGQLEPESLGESWKQNRSFPSWMVPGDLRSLSPLLAALLQDGLVLGLSLSVFTWLHQSAPLGAWVALVFAVGACVRGTQGLVELALVTPSDNRPGLRVTDPEVRKAALWVVQYFGMLLAVRVVLVQLLTHTLGADRIADLLSESIGIVGWVLLGVALIRWGGLLRAQIEAGGTGSALARWIVGTNSSRITTLLGSCAAALLLVFRFSESFLQGVIESRGGLSWLGSFLARRQLRDDSEHVHTPLPASVRRAIGAGALRGLSLEQEVQEVQNRYALWKQDPRRGMVAITGDRGVGKGVLMSLLAAGLDGDPIQATAPIGHTQAKQALRWLSGVAGIEAISTSEELVDALKKRPPTIFLLSNIHRLFLRAVGHYDGLDTVLEVMQATGRHHFWVASLHEPAWTFLHGMSHVGHLTVFPSRIRLGDLSPADLSQWLMSQTRRGGIEPQFNSLLQRKGRGQDQMRMLERAERAYWRLLTDTSQGNPSVAIRLWMDGLRPLSEQGAANVGLFKAHGSEELEELGDNELFALTALILHEDLTVHELHIVLNQPESGARALCRGLEQRTLITETESGRYKVRLNWLPAVERYLRRRSFMHKS